jgi:hypothetical protein
MFKSQIITDYINDKISVTIKVEEKTYLENVYIKRVLIDTIGTVSSTGPSEKAVLLDVGNKKEVVLNTKDINLSIKDVPLFFYVEPSTIPVDAPCGEDKAYEYIGYTFNRKPIYDSFVCALNNIRDCKFPNELATKYLKYKALDMAMENEQFDKAAKLYKDYFTNNTITIKSKCPCMT